MERVHKLKENLGILNELNTQTHTRKLKFNSLFQNCSFDKENKKDLAHYTNTSFDLQINKNQDTCSSYTLSNLISDFNPSHENHEQLLAESLKNKTNIKNIFPSYYEDLNFNNENNHSLLSFMKDDEKDNLHLYDYSYNNNLPSNISSTAFGSFEERKNSLTLHNTSATHKKNTNTMSRNKTRKKTQGNIPCEHCGCKLLFTTLKQKLNHHNKMNKTCRKDTIQLLKALTELKKMLLSLKAKHSKSNAVPLVPESLVNKYHSILSDIPHKEYALLYPGISLMDNISAETEIDDDDEDELL